MWTKEYRQKYFRERYQRNRKRALIILGGSCVVCGDDSEINNNLHIDHINPINKSINIDQALLGWKESRWLEELSKCQLLCASCHSKKHNGKPHPLWYCKCLECKKYRAQHSKNYKLANKEKLSLNRKINKEYQKIFKKFFPEFT